MNDTSKEPRPEGHETHQNAADRRASGGIDRRVDFTKRAFMAVGVIALVVVLLLFVWYSVGVLLLMFAGILLAIFLRGLSDLLCEYTPLSASWSLTVVMLVLALAIGASTWLLAPKVAVQVDLLAASLPQSLEQLGNYFRQYPWIQRMLAQAPSVDTLMTNQVNILGQVTGVLSTTLSALVNILVILSIGIYLAVNPDLYIGGLVRLVPIGKRDRAGEILQELGYTLRWWLIGRFFSMGVVGIMTSLGLWLLGVPLALTLGLLAALLTFIPSIGPVLSAVPAVLLALLQSPVLALYVILLYFSIQLVESYLLTPLVQQRAIALPPALIITALVLLGVLLGLMGLILATPLTAAALVLVKMLYVEDTLGDPINGSDDDRGKN